MILNALLEKNNSEEAKLNIRDIVSDREIYLGEKRVELLVSIVKGTL